jgi:FdrA protein
MNAADREKENRVTSLLCEQVKVVNVGLNIFHKAIVEQEGSSVQVDWRPPAGGDTRLAALLSKVI